jgi:hypothetical protein
MQDFGFHDLPAALLRGKIGLRQKHHAHGNPPAARPIAAALNRLGKEILWYFHMNPGAIARLAIRIDRASVPHSTQRIDARLHHLAPRNAIERRNQTHAAGIVFLLRRVCLTEQTRIGVPSRNEIFSKDWVGQSRPPHI